MAPGGPGNAQSQDVRSPQLRRSATQTSPQEPQIIGGIYHIGTVLLGTSSEHLVISLESMLLLAQQNLTPPHSVRLGRSLEASGVESDWFIRRTWMPELAAQRLRCSLMVCPM